MSEDLIALDQAVCQPSPSIFQGLNIGYSLEDVLISCVYQQIDCNLTK